MLKPASVAAVTALALVALGSAYWLRARDSHARDPQPVVPYPKATPPPPPSPDFTPSRELAPSAEEIARAARDHIDALTLEIRRALVARDARERETAFTFLMPELVQIAPERLADLVKQEEPGEARDALRTELARQWIARDRDAAIGWMKSLDVGERNDAAMDAVHALAAVAPGQAIYVADQFDIGRDDGYLEHLVQVWSEDDISAVDRWLATQPESPRKAQLRARVDVVRERKKAG